MPEVGEGCREVVGFSFCGGVEEGLGLLVVVVCFDFGGDGAGVAWKARCIWIRRAVFIARCLKIIECARWLP